MDGYQPTSSSRSSRRRKATLPVVALAAALAFPAAASGAEADDEAIIAIIESASPAVVTVLPDGGRGGSGSGVIVDADGLVITNGHVVANARSATVVLADGTALDGRITAVDTLTDFALIDVDTTDLPAVEIGNSTDLRVGQLAIVLGNPLGQFPQSASVGIVSGLDRSLGGASTGRLNHLIQTDAAVNPGSSGGAVLDGDGELIGITTAEAGSSDGIGFALPISLARPIIEQVLAGEEILRPYIGVRYREVDPQLAAQLDLPVRAGAWIVADAGDGAAVVAGGPAEAAGIVDGDIITAVDGVEVDLQRPLDLLILGSVPGDDVTVTIVRDGSTIESEITLGVRPANLG